MVEENGTRQSGSFAAPNGKDVLPDLSLARSDLGAE